MTLWAGAAWLPLALLLLQVPGEPGWAWAGAPRGRKEGLGEGEGEKVG